MKELTIEEKAQRYDEAIIEMKPIYDLAKEQGHTIDVQEFERIFPELKENEDERIRKIIKQSLKSYFEGKLSIGTNDVDYAACLSWLEKQGEQKPADKVEPKFKVGDWIVYNENIYQIRNIALKQYYECLKTDGTTHPLDFEYVDSKSRLWTIQDSKDGDILTFHSDSLIWIYKNRNQYHACVNRNATEKFSVNGFTVITNPNDIRPATDDERRILFKYIKKSGYVWDSDNKKLKSAFVNDCDKNN